MSQSIHVIIPCFLLVVIVPLQAGESPLAKPLQAFDLNKDGKLTGDELVQARQAHHRGGQSLAPDLRRYQDFLSRRKAEWLQKHQEFLDGNGDGKLDETETQRTDVIWAEIAARYDIVRLEIIRKYDLNDDGRLTDAERTASQAEANQRRIAIEHQVMGEYRSHPVRSAAGAP